MHVLKSTDFMIRILTVAMLLGFVPHAHAVRVTDLYEALVPVENQAPATRADALKGVLRKVVIKVTGQSVLPASLLQSASQVEHMVEQFGYESRQEPASSQRQLYLWAKLNPVGVKQLIRRAGLPIWPEERPATLVWLAIDGAAGRQMMAEGSEHEAVSLLHDIAGQRGLPLVLPLMDLQESSAIDFDAIATMQLDSLQSASARYGSHHVLVGYIQHVDGGLWRGRWKLMDDAEQVTMTPEGTLSDVLASGINPLASRIAQQFSSLSYVDSEQYIDLAVDDINGAADYARSLKYLQSLSLVSQVDVVGVDKEMVNFRLHTKADLAAVVQVIGLGRVLYARDAIDRLVYGLNP
ncbi:MAG: DUF2066 domain-containing protein [Gammaproteobacteria bacterium]|nr:DUF2066 domain-containing protein [Gammaproteobacteria bacterium]